MQIYDCSDYSELLVGTPPEVTLLENWENTGNLEAMPIIVFGKSKTLQGFQAVWTIQEEQELKAALWAVSNLLGRDWSEKVIISVSKEKYWANSKKHFGSCTVTAEEQGGELKFAAQIKLLPRGEERNWALGNAGKGIFLGTSIHEMGHVVWSCMDDALQNGWNHHCLTFKTLSTISRYADKSYNKTGEWEEAFCEALVAMFLSPRFDPYLKGRIEELKSILDLLKKNGLRKK